MLYLDSSSLLKLLWREPESEAVARRVVAEETVVVTFTQDYRSSNLSNRTVKRQYWAREGGRWRGEWCVP